MGQHKGWKPAALAGVAWLVGTGGILWGATACGESTSTDVPCITRTDCPLGQICLNGECMVGIDSGRPPPFVEPPKRDAGPVDREGGPGPTTDGGPDCKSTATCDDLGAACGLVHDGCSFIDCGDCEEPETCAGGGVANQCGEGECTPQISCSSEDYECGFLMDDCLVVHDCGDCPRGETCGGGGVPNRCGVDKPICTPTTCRALGADCGSPPDGCGGRLYCGPPCGNPCTPTTCRALGADCGSPPDGCGGSLYCGPPCVTPCTPLRCGAPGVECGRHDDGCGGTLNCGDFCGPNEVCDDGQCVGFVMPCDNPGCGSNACGDIENDCGFVAHCGPCPPGHACILNECVMHPF